MRFIWEETKAVWNKFKDSPRLLKIPSAIVFLAILTAIFVFSRAQKVPVSFNDRLCPETEQRLSTAHNELVHQNDQGLYLFKTRVSGFTDKYELLVPSSKSKPYYLGCDRADILFSGRLFEFFSTIPSNFSPKLWQDKMGNKYVFGVAEKEGQVVIVRMALDQQVYSEADGGQVWVQDEVILPEKVTVSTVSEVEHVASADWQHIVVWVHGKAYYLNLKWLDLGRDKLKSDKRYIELTDIPSPYDTPIDKTNVLFSKDNSMMLLKTGKDAVGHTQFLLDFRAIDSGEIKTVKLQTQDIVGPSLSGTESPFYFYPHSLTDDQNLQHIVGYYLKDEDVDSPDEDLHIYSLKALYDDGTDEIIAQDQYELPALTDLGPGVFSISESRQDGCAPRIDQTRKILLVRVKDKKRSITKTDTNYFINPFIVQAPGVVVDAPGAPITIGYKTLKATGKTHKTLYGDALYIYNVYLNYLNLDTGQNQIMFSHETSTPYTCVF